MHVVTSLCSPPEFLPLHLVSLLKDRRIGGTSANSVARPGEEALAGATSAVAVTVDGEVSDVRTPDVDDSVGR